MNETLKGRTLIRNTMGHSCINSCRFRWSDNLQFEARDSGFQDAWGIRL